MKNKIVLAAGLAAALFAPAAAGAQEDKGKLTREQAEGFAKEIAGFTVKKVALPAVNTAVNTVAAGYWALWDLVNDLSAQRKNGGKADPDPGLVDTAIRLRMRSDSGSLCSKFGGSCKDYPGDAEFAKAVKLASGDIKAYAAGFKTAQNFAKKRHRDRIDKFLESARARVVFSLPMTRNPGVQVPPPSPGEAKYIQLSLEKKQGDKFSFPPWP